jgi:transcription elongation factor SPT6
MTTPNSEELFSIVTGENDYSLYVGMLVSCEVTKIQEYRADVMIDGRMRGYLRQENISDASFNDISEVLSKGMQLSGVIIAVRKDKMLVEVSTKQSVVNRGEIWWMTNRFSDESMRSWWSEYKRGGFDRHFNENAALSLLEQSRQEAQRSRKSGTEKGIKRRVIYHSAFKNCTYIDAEEELRDKPAGEFLFRPSSKGTDFISITWAFQENWFKHIDVEEKDKRPGDQSLGKKLCIDDVKEPFSDLNDIIANYIGPMNDLVSEMVSHKWFYNGDYQDVKPMLVERSLNEPGSIPYYICFDKRYCGYFCLAWYIKESQTEPMKKLVVKVRPNVSG